MSNPVLPGTIALAAALVFVTVAGATEQPVRFDFSHHEIGLNVSVKGKQLFVLLDTGVDPSVIDLGRARALGLPVKKG